MDWSQIVLPDGRLNQHRVFDLEVISQNQNVNRLALTRFRRKDMPDRSFIFKPALEEKPVKLQRWIEASLFSQLPNLCTPRMVASHIDQSTGTYWMIFEDFGHLTPGFAPEVRVAAVREMSSWHSLDLSFAPVSFKPYLPPVDDVIAFILEHKDRLIHLLTPLNVPESLIAPIFAAVEKVGGNFPAEIVVSHGDYISLNVSLRNDQLVVMDWEFVQLNALYWDLYTLLDMASYRYRIQIDAPLRIAALNAYVDARRQTGWVPPQDFIRNYHLFTAVYTIRILEWLAEDLERDRFEKDVLQTELAELTQILMDCRQAIECERILEEIRMPPTAIPWHMHHTPNA